MSAKQLATVAVLAMAVGGLGACGGIGKAQTRLRSAVDAQKPTLDQCYEAQLERDRTASGDMDLILHVNEDSGEVQEVEVVRSSVGDAQLEQCVKTSIVGVGIEPPGANLEVEYNLQFSPSA